MQGLDTKKMLNTQQSAIKKRKFGNSLRAAIAISKLTTDIVSTHSPKSKGSKFSFIGKEEQRSVRSNARSLAISNGSKTIAIKDQAVIKDATQTELLRQSTNWTPSEQRGIKTPNVGVSGRKHNVLMEFLKPRASI